MKQLTTYLRIFGCSLHRSLLTHVVDVYSIILSLAPANTNRKPLNPATTRCSGLFCLGLCYTRNGYNTIACIAKALLWDSYKVQPWRKSLSGKIRCEAENSLTVEANSGDNRDPWDTRRGMAPKGCLFSLKVSDTGNKNSRMFSLSHSARIHQRDLFYS